MANKRFDFLIYILAIGVFVLIGLIWFWPSKTLSQKGTLKILVNENASIIEKSVLAGDDVFLNGSNNVSKIENYKKIQEGILIKISGPAEQKNEIYNFNGQRITIGSKAELHGRFLARGVIYSFEISK